MNQIRNILSFLLIAGVACVHAQQPIVKINSDSQATECDVTAPAGAPIFQMDATGNVLVKGALSGQGCGGSGGANPPSFGFNPPASGVLINGGTSTVAAGSIGTVPLTYQAYNATSCSVGTPTTTGTCPAVAASGGSCTGAGAQKSCAPAGATLSIPTVAQMGANTSCAYTATATCAPGSVTSSAVLTVTTTPTGGGDVPPQCTSLHGMHNSAGAAWSRMTSNTSVKFGDGVTANGVDPKDYVAVWSYPGTSVPWPGTTGLSTRPSTMPTMYFSEKFTVPTDGSVTTNPSWAWSGSGINSNAAFTISICPGDFGQTNTQITQTSCKVNKGNSSSGLKAKVSATPVAGFCSVVPGQAYYFNILPMATLPVNDVSTSDCTGTCTPWLGRN